jgi:hypothetical protein
VPRGNVNGTRSARSRRRLLAADATPPRSLPHGRTLARSWERCADRITRVPPPKRRSPKEGRLPGSYQHAWPPSVAVSAHRPSRLTDHTANTHEITARFTRPGRRSLTASRIRRALLRGIRYSESGQGLKPERVASRRL